MESITNKIIYNELVRYKFSVPFIHTHWNSYFNKIINWKNVYISLYKLDDNRIKQFKFKLIHKEIRYTWKISSNPYNFCNETETYQHLFIEFKTLNEFWNKIIELLNVCGVSNNIKSLKNIIIGYKIDNPEYQNINKLYALVGFSIYKAYFISESKIKPINYFSIFCQEFKGD